MEELSVRNNSIPRLPRLFRFSQINGAAVELLGIYGRSLTIPIPSSFTRVQVHSQEDDNNAASYLVNLLTGSGTRVKASFLVTKGKIKTVSFDKSLNSCTKKEAFGKCLVAILAEVHNRDLSYDPKRQITY